MTVFQNVLFKLNSLSPISNYRCHLVNRLSTTNVINYPPKQTLEDKLGIPPKPKRPKTPFLKFVTENRLRFLQQNPEATAPVVIKQLAEEWKTVSDSVKEKMCEEFSKEREKYLESLRRYEKLLTPVDKEEIAKAKLEEKREKEKRALKKKKEELGCPKKPATSYILFMKSKLPERGDTPFSEFQKQIKSGWSALPPPEKTRFETIYKKEMEAYREKMDLWTAQMKEKGIKLSEENSKMSKPKDTPRKPGLPFTYFQKIRFQERGNIPQLEFQKQLADEWAHLSPKEKKKYEDMHQKDMEQYKLKMESWSKSRESKLKPGVRSE